MSHEKSRFDFRGGASNPNLITTPEGVTVLRDPNAPVAREMKVEASFDADGQVRFKAGSIFDSPEMKAFAEKTGFGDVFAEEAAKAGALPIESPPAPPAAIPSAQDGLLDRYALHIPPDVDMDEAWHLPAPRRQASAASSPAPLDPPSRRKFGAGEGDIVVHTSQKKLARFCPSCRHEFGNEKYCPECGTKRQSFLENVT